MSLSSWSRPPRPSTAACRTRRSSPRRAARRRGGVGGRRRPGRRAARVRRHGHRRRGARARRHGHRARATPTSPRPSGCCAGRSGSTPRPGPPRSPCSPTTRRTRCTSPPTWYRQAEHDPSAASVLVTDQRRAGGRRRRRAGAAGRGHQAHRAIRTALDRPAVRHVLVADVAAGPRGRRRVRRRAPGDPDRRRRARSRCRCATRARSSSGPGRRCRSATTAPGSNHVLPTGGCARHSAGLSVQTFLRGVHLVEYTRGRARARWRTTWSRSPTAEDLPAHGQAVTARFAERWAGDGWMRHRAPASVRGHPRRPPAAGGPAGQDPVRRAAA